MSTYQSATLLYHLLTGVWFLRNDFYITIGCIAVLPVNITPLKVLRLGAFPFSRFQSPGCFFVQGSPCTPANMIIVKDGFLIRIKGEG